MTPTDAKTFALRRAQGRAVQQAQEKFMCLIKEEKQ